jgi:hypothetical protein
MTLIEKTGRFAAKYGQFKHPIQKPNPCFSIYIEVIPKGMYNGTKSAVCNILHVSN